MGTVRDGELSGMGNVRDGKCPGWELSGGNCPGWELSGMGTVRDGNCPGWELSTWWELSGMGTVRDGNCPRIRTHVRTTDVNSPPKIPLLKQARMRDFVSPFLGCCPCACRDVDTFHYVNTLTLGTIYNTARTYY